MDNLIAEKQVSSTRIELQNVDEAALYGGEAEVILSPVKGLKFTANMAYTRGRDTKNDEDLPSIPPFNGFIRLRYDSTPGIWGMADLAYNASQKHVPDGERGGGSMDPNRPHGRIQVHDCLHQT